MERTTRQQMWRDMVSGEEINKAAELANTYDMPAQHVPLDSKVVNRKAVTTKVAEAHMGKLVSAPAGEAGALPNNEHCEEKPAPPSLPQQAALKPHVDVSGSDPKKDVQKKEAQHYALPERKMYPLDDYQHVKSANAYFMDTYKFMEPEVRHEYCQNLVKRASALDIVVDSLVERYGASTYAREADFDACIHARRSSITDEDQLALLDKVASLRTQVDPEIFAATLSEFDKVAHLHLKYPDVPDPYFSTFGKTAGEDVDPLDSVLIGNEYITRKRLAAFLQNNVAAVSLRWGGDLAKELAKDPKDVFDSLPRDQRLVIMRMANNDDSPVQQGVPTA